jgi:hypothetical protein
MASKPNILLVEGESDRAFFEVICRSLGLDNSVHIAPPKALNGQFNSKEGVFNHLPVLLAQLDDGSIKRLAVVLDADTPPNGSFLSTRNRITGIVSSFKYYPPTALPAPGGGLVYKNSDGLADLGLWVMPDNTSNGMLEDWIKQCITPSEAGLFGQAVSTVAGLPTPTKFSSLHVTKAEVATWLAWQKKPGHGMHQAVEEKLLDTNHAKYLALINWLLHIF